MMNIVLLGMPGAGKGTQGAIIKKELEIPHISTGDMFREAIASGTAMGLEAKAYMDKGELVPDSVVLGMVKDRILQQDCEKGFILDGFPRNVSQAEALEELLNSVGKKITHVLDFVLTADEVVSRLSSRRSCGSCGRIYSTLTHDFKAEGTCGVCGGELVHREDDREEVILNRLKVYEHQTAPLESFYESRGLLVRIDAGRSIEEITASVLKLLSEGGSR